MPTLRRRPDSTWIALALTIGIGGTAFATTTPGAGDAAAAAMLATSVELVAAMSDGTSRTQSFRISSLDPP